MRARSDVRVESALINLKKKKKEKKKEVQSIK
jgi:hypothetical protein